MPPVSGVDDRQPVGDHAARPYTPPMETGTFDGLERQAGSAMSGEPSGPPIAGDLPEPAGDLPEPATDLPEPAGAELQLLKAREAERSRLAQELHDGPAQVLANALFKVDLIDRLLQRDPAAVPAELDALRRLLERELDDMRSFMTQLRPPLLEQAGLDAALREVASDVQAAIGIPVTVQLAAPAEALDEARQLVVLRVAQEALRNTAKHAQAQRAWLETSLIGGGGAADSPTWVLEIGDDGKGFVEEAQATASGRRRSFGLRFMRERAELIGGRLAIETHHEKGTRVRLAIPARQRRENG